MANKNQLVRFKKRSEFIHLMKEGKRLFITDWLAIQWLVSDDETLRVGWTIPGYVGSAVTRNKLKRWLKVFLEQKWEPRGPKIKVHFLFKKKPVTFYKGLEHEYFDSILGSGLRNVERRTSAKK